MENSLDQIRILRDDIRELRDRKEQLAQVYEPLLQAKKNAIEEIEKAFVQANHELIGDVEHTDTTLKIKDDELRNAVRQNWLSLPPDIRKETKSLGNGTGVSTKFERAVDTTVPGILEDVRQKFPTLVTFDADRLVKQSEIYDIVEEETEDGTHFYIAEMPYIKITQKVTPTIKKEFYALGEDGDRQ